MLTTGLVSLNVHEALTFDGTEIVLHPDLFAPDVHSTVSIGNSGRTGSNIRPSPSTATAASSVAVSAAGSVTNSANPQAPTSSDVSKDAGQSQAPQTTAQSQNQQQQSQQQQPQQQQTQQQQQRGGNATVPPAPSSDKMSYTGNSTVSSKRLEVGDMIEIRVWDPIPAKERSQLSGVSGVFRKKSMNSVHSHGSLGSGSTEDQKSGATGTKSAPPVTGGTLTTITPDVTIPEDAAVTATTAQSGLDAAGSSLSRKLSGVTAISDAAESMQYSEFSASEHTTSAVPTPTTKPVAGIASSGDSFASATTPVIAPASSKEIMDSFSLPEASVETATQNISKDEDVLDVPSSPNMAPGKNIITMPATTGKPPVAARNRSNTADAPRGSTLLPKPPLQPRAATHGEAAAATATPVDARKRMAKPTHSREISDMTLDSTVFGHHQPQLNNSGELSVPLGVDFERQEDEEGENDEEQSDDDDDTQEDDILSQIEKTHKMRFSFCMLVTEKTLTSLKGSARTQVSILRQVADLYKLSSYDMISVNRIEKQDEQAVLSAVSADFVLVSIKDQFISRGDMHFFQNSLLGSWIYEGQRLTETARGIKAYAWLIRHDNQPAKSGIITENTMITFRSRSARIFWLVQISAEMWDYASPYERERGEEHESLCEIYFDKWLSFVHRLFDKWKELEVTHSLTVVFFSRTFLSSRQATSGNADGAPLECKDVYGRPYEDHYKTVIENETRADWESLVMRLKEEFLKYPIEVGWNLSTGDLGRRLSSASQGNVLEAINITTNLCQFHYLDRDLNRTGNSIVVISPGCGVFEVDKGLASITYQRMLDIGIGSDMLSLALPPLHVAPFFLYNNEYRSVESRGVDASETYYEIPHWMHLSFISYEGESENMLQPQTTSANSAIPKKLNLSGKPPKIGANGFILPHRDSSESLVPARVKVSPNSPTSFSMNGIAASSPEKPRVISQERALNEGRDFWDILEACRPRNSGTMPSALQALLKMYRRSEKNDRSRSDYEETEAEVGTDELKPLREWTSMEFDLDEQYKFIRPRSGSLGYHDKGSDRSDSASALSSPSSSYMSIVGVSYDRHMLGRHKGMSAPIGGIHLQRSPSLQYLDAQELAGDAETIPSDDGSWSTTGLGAMSDAATDEEVASSNRGSKRGRDKHAAQLRSRMASHDSNYFAEPQIQLLPAAEVVPIRTQGIPLNESYGSLSPVGGIVSQLPQRFNSRGPESNHGGGGIGAALSQYTVNHDFLTMGNDSSNRFRNMNPNDSIGSARGSRINTAGLFSGRSAQMYEMGGRGVSPLLLPPSGVHSGAMTNNNDPPDLIRPDDRTMSSRLPPWDYRPLLSDGASSRSLNTPAQIRKAPTASDILSGELFLDPRATKMDNIDQNLARSVGAGSPSAADLHRSNPTKHHSHRQGQNHQRRESSISRHAQKKAFNPFRQADEDKVLAKRSHNRRRWSHVFPKGEIEFKRHAGPIWKSLTSPAILPLSVDYFPSRQEIDQYFQFNIYNVTLSDFDETHYSTHADLLMEMVRQRITQDYQLVPPSCVDESIKRKPLIGHAAYSSNRGRATSVNPNPTLDKSDDAKPIKHFLTMGHQLQELTYDPSTDTIEVVRFNDKSAQNDANNTYKYQYLLYSPLTGKYAKVVQIFKKYANQYNWNKVDRIICGDEDKSLREGMRFRRLMFGLIPPKFASSEEEKDYVTKFKRLLEYLNKLRETDDANLGVKINLGSETNANLHDTRNVTGVDSMKRSAIQLRKGKRDPFEWIEIASDSELSTTKTYRIVYNWLAASSGKVDTQVQLLHRRCTQYGLTLIFFPQTSVSRDLLLNPFKAPPAFTVRDNEKAKLVYTSILDLDFVNDGVFYTQTKPILECIDRGEEFDFGRRLSTAARQYVHRSGTLFVRLIRDRRGWIIAVVIPNSRYIKKDEENLGRTAKNVFRALVYLVSSLTEDEEHGT